jgi:hypothetical protein
MLLNNTRRRRPYGLECQLEMTDDSVDGFRFFNKRDEAHLASAGWSQKGINFINLGDHLCPAFDRHVSLVVFNNGGMRRRLMPSWNSYQEKFSHKLTKNCELAKITSQF